MTNYKTLQLTNNSIGAVAIDSNMPLGIITRKVCSSNGDCKTFNVTNSNNDTVYLNEKGYYYINYQASLVTSTADILTISLIANGEAVFTTSVTGTAGGTVNISLPYELRVFDNCCSCPNNNPMSIQLLLKGNAISGGTSNLTIEKRRD